MTRLPREPLWEDRDDRRRYNPSDRIELLSRFTEDVTPRTPAEEDAERVRDEAVNLAIDIKDTRRGKGWTQAELARRAGVSERTVRNVENLRFGRKPQVATLHKLAEALGATTETFMGFTLVKWPREIDRGRAIAWAELESEGEPVLRLDATGKNEYP